MSQFFQIHPEDPQHRLIHRTVEIVQRGGLIVYPTDSFYALGCHIGDKSAVDRMRRIRGVPNDHNFTLVCRDLSEISTYARVDNMVYRLLKAYTPGPYTFILKATKELPKRLQDPKRRTIGIRVPADTIAQAILAELNEPLMSSTVLLPGSDLPLADPYDIRDLLNNKVDLVIDGGHHSHEPTWVIDLTQDEPEILRTGAGNAPHFQT